MVIRSRQTKIIASVVAASILASCAPKLTPAKQYPQAQMEFKTSQSDAKLAIKEVSPEELVKHLSADQQMKTGELFRSIGNLYSLADANNSPELKTLAIGIDNQFYGSVNTTAKVRFEQSPIMLAALGYGKGYTSLLTRLLELIEGSVTKYPWLKDVKFENYEVESQKYVSWLLENVRAELAAKGIALSDKMIADAEAAIYEQIAERQVGLQQTVDGLKTSESVEMLVSNATDFIAESLSMDIESANLAELKKLLESVTALAPKIDAITDSKSAAKAIAASKPALSAIEIKAIEESAAAPEAIKATLIQALATTLTDKIESLAATNGFPQLPNQLLALGAMGIGLDPELVKEIARDPKAALKKLAAQFGEAKLVSAPAGIPGIESSEIDLVFQSNSLKISGKKSKELKTSAEAIGSSLSNSMAKIIEADEQLAKAEKETQNEETTAQNEQKRKENNTLVLSQLNKLVLLSGFKTEDDKVTSYTTVQDRTKAPLELANQKGVANRVAAVSDDLTLSKNLTAVATENNVSVRGQAALLQGLSDTISYLRDWKQNGFEKGLGQVTIAQLLGSDATEGPLAGKAIDKSILFTLAIGNAATILQNIQKDFTPFYLIGPRDSALWLSESQPRNEKGDVTDSRATTGIVDIVEGRRTSLTKTGDVARYIMALMSFLEATDGIEKTKASVLTAKNDKGFSQLDLLIGARANLPKLLATLTNMLSGTLKQADGSFAAQFNKDTRQVSGRASAVDTALAVQALVKAANMFGAQAYSTAALEAYFAMNKNLWNSELQFYSRSEDSGQVPSYNELVSILNSINTLAPHMPADSRAQWKAIAKNWIGALELLSKNLENAAKK